MNAKKAKKLRQMLRQVEASQKADGKEVTAVSYTEDERKRKYAMVPTKQGGASSDMERVVVAAGTVTIAPNTVKGLYKRLKEQYRSNSHK